jgi:hypothetical protein
VVKSRALGISAAKRFAIVPILRLESTFRRACLLLRDSEGGWGEGSGEHYFAVNVN